MCEWYEEDDIEMKTIETIVDFQEQLKVWAVDNLITHKAINDLLRVLKSNGHPELPKDSRTHTPKIVITKEMGGGSFWYGGIKNCLLNLHPNTNEKNEILLNFNMDGLPLSRSSKIEFWPILMSIANDLMISPMVVAIYCGVGKPSVDEFLENFVNELLEVLACGLTIDNVHFKVSINGFICDTPARCYIKCK